MLEVGFDERTDGYPDCISANFYAGSATCVAARGSQPIACASSAIHRARGGTVTWPATGSCYAGLHGAPLWVRLQWSASACGFKGNGIRAGFECAGLYGRARCCFWIRAVYARVARGEQLLAHELTHVVQQRQFGQRDLDKGLFLTPY